MQLHTLKQKTKRITKRRVGRGGKRGKTSGRGTKGQNARAGSHVRPALRDIIKKLPKMRGYRVGVIGPQMEVVNLGAIEEVFVEGDVISPATLLAKKLVRRTGGVVPVVKILGSGTLSKQLAFEKVFVSESAKKKIATVGGSIK